MNENIEFLNYIYQNSKMGIIGIDQIKSSIHDKKFLKVIKEQENDYYNICTKAMRLLSLANEERENVNGIAKVMTTIDAKIKLSKDSTVSGIAKMMIEGNNKGVVEIIEKINNYPNADKKIIKLAKDLLKMEEQNIENLKQYL